MRVFIFAAAVLFSNIFIIQAYSKIYKQEDVSANTAKDLKGTASHAGHGLWGGFKNKLQKNRDHVKKTRHGFSNKFHSKFKNLRRGTSDKIIGVKDSARTQLRSSNKGLHDKGTSFSSSAYNKAYRLKGGVSNRLNAAN